MIIKSVEDVYVINSSKPLDWLYVQVLLFSWCVVWAHDAHLLPCRNDTREDTTKGIESTLVGGWHHLGDVHHERSFRITVLYTWKVKGGTWKSWQKGISLKCPTLRNVVTHPWRPRHLQDPRKADHSGTFGLWQEKEDGWWSSGAKRHLQATSGASQPGSIETSMCQQGQW